MVSCLIGTEKHSCLPTDIDVIKWAQRLRELRETMWQLQGPAAVFSYRLDALCLSLCPYLHIGRVVINLSPYAFQECFLLKKAIIYSYGKSEMKPRWKLTLVDQACCLQVPQCTTKLGPEDRPNDGCNSKMTGVVSSCQC